MKKEGESARNTLFSFFVYGKGILTDWHGTKLNNQIRKQSIIH